MKARGGPRNGAPHGPGPQPCERFFAARAELVQISPTSTVWPRSRYTSAMPASLPFALLGVAIGAGAVSAAGEMPAFKVERG